MGCCVVVGVVCWLLVSSAEEIRLVVVGRMMWPADPMIFIEICKRQIKILHNFTVLDQYQYDMAFAC